MNPQELSTMVWMGQFASPLDENLANIYGQPVPTVMDDISQPSPSLVRILHGSSGSDHFDYRSEARPADDDRFQHRAFFEIIHFHSLFP